MVSCWRPRLYFFHYNKFRFIATDPIIKIEKEMKFLEILAGQEAFHIHHITEAGEFISPTIVMLQLCSIYKIVVTL